MMSLTKMTLAVVMAFGTSTGAASAQQSLRNESYVTEGLIAVGIAFEISEVCPNIGARTLRGLNYLNQLRSHARGLGYSNAQIDDFRKDKAEKDRLEAIARQRLANMGATPGDVASHCAVGRSEIAKESTIGYLLR